MFKEFIMWFSYGPLARFVNFVFVKEVKGIKNIPDRGFILASNHSSYLDIPALSSTLVICKKRRIRYIAKKELFYNPIMRNILEAGRIIPVDKEKPGKEVFEEAISSLRNGDIIGIYPEGGRSLTGKIQKGKTGVARLALWSKAPVVPVGIKGTFELMPKGKTIPKFKKEVIVNIGKPLYFTNYYKKTITKKLLRIVTGEIMGKIAELS